MSMPSPSRHLSTDELSHRASTGLAIRRGEVKISDPIPSSYRHNGAEMDTGAYEERQSTPRPAGTWSGKSSGTHITGKNDGTQPNAHVSRFTERTSLGPSIAISNMSSTGSKESTPQRRNAGLRATIRRMFSSKKDKTTALPRRAESLMDPVRVLHMTGTQSQGMHDASPLHHSDVLIRSALHSHAPEPPSQTDSTHLPRSEPVNTQLGQRRNTVPSLMLAGSTQTRADGENTREPLSPQRPTTAIRRQTPPSSQFYRRSRSADDLAEILQKRPQSSERRDRAEEIAFWRNSIVVDPLPSVPTATRDIPEPMPVSMHKHDVSEAKSRPSFEPVQDFDFGLASSHPKQPNTLMERVNTLEVKLQDFEYALSNLQGTRQELPDTSKKHTPSRSETKPFLESATSSAPDSTTSGISYPSTPSEQWRPNFYREHQKVDRASKATTVKPVHRHVPSNRSEVSTTSSVRLTRDQYDILCALMQDEKIARQTLEMQLMNLQKEVDILKSPVYAYVRPMDYPTPSPDQSFHGANYNTSPRTLRRSPRLPAKEDLNETSRFSMSETDPGTEVDEPYPEVYETPQENLFQFESRRFSPPTMI